MEYDARLLKIADPVPADAEGSAGWVDALFQSLKRDNLAAAELLDMFLELIENGDIDIASLYSDVLEDATSAG